MDSHRRLTVTQQAETGEGERAQHRIETDRYRYIRKRSIWNLVPKACNFTDETPYDGIFSFLAVG
jgi:hypothetical protein